MCSDTLNLPAQFAFTHIKHTGNTIIIVWWKNLCLALSYVTVYIYACNAYGISEVSQKINIPLIELIVTDYDQVLQYLYLLGFSGSIS